MTSDLYYLHWGIFNQKKGMDNMAIFQNFPGGGGANWNDATPFILQDSNVTQGAAFYVKKNIGSHIVGLNYGGTKWTTASKYPTLGFVPCKDMQVTFDTNNGDQTFTLVKGETYTATLQSATTTNYISFKIKDSSENVIVTARVFCPSGSGTLMTIPLSQFN